LGVALLKIPGNLRSAIAAFNESMRLKQENSWVYIDWGDVLKEKGALDEAISAFQEASRLQPDEAGIYINWGNALKDTGALDKAVAAYDQAFATLRRVLAGQPRPLQNRALLRYAHGARAEALIESGRFTEAEQNYQEALDLGPSDPWIWYCGAPLLLHRGDLESYSRVCQAMLARFSSTDDLEVAEWTVKTCLLVPDAVRDLRPVLQLAERAVTGTEQWVLYRRFLVVRGMADYRAGNFAGAIDWLDTALSLEGDNYYHKNRYLAGTAHTFLAMAHHQLGHAQDARQALDQAHKLPQWTRPDLDRGDPSKLQLDLVRREAEQLLKGRAEHLK
jgi:tetratricopeptide (TPR) repeat protein